jgi:hypothetical protein
MANEGRSPKDKRERQGNIPQKTKPRTLDDIKKHTSSLPARRSYYTQRRNRHKVLLPETRNKRQMHQMFIADTGNPCTNKQEQQHVL